MKNAVRVAGRIVSLAAVALLMMQRGAGAQISPGKLARPHAFLDGIQNCVKCHKVGRGPSAKKCLACHKEIQQRLDEQRGFHFMVVEQEKQACFGCHSDHAGRQFQLVYWPDGMENFDHARTGYRLRGKHQTLKCRDCHQPKFVREDLRKIQPKIDLERTFWGCRRTAWAAMKINIAGSSDASAWIATRRTAGSRRAASTTRGRDSNSPVGTGR
ncbi:MAG: cytochrome c3 family protein [candidate division KSB1 bacterium]|nr:cytochrome c3 family protein [candidate division KSB1 bacterium]